MKSLIILAILAFQFNCLQTKKSSFDLKQGGVPGLLIFGVSSGLISLGGSTSTDKTAPTVTVTNLKTKGTIETGILMGTSTDNVSVSKVEVQLNTGSFQTATGTTSWTYKLPLTGWTGGNTNTINIKVTDTSGNIGTATLSTLTKGLNKDVNGDGYNDIAVGAPSASSVGKVYVFNGSANGIVNTSAASADKILTGNTSEQFGKKILNGDFNGDGFGDLFVCSYTGNTAGASNRGYVFYGSSTGLGTGTAYPGYALDFCYDAASGDFNNDGYSDIAVSDINTSTTGVFYVFYGGSNGLSSSSTVFSGTGSNYGYSLSVNDINGDGFSDLAVSNSFNSNIYYYFGQSSGLNATPASITVSNALSIVYLGDISNDGKSDLIVAEPTLSTQTGRVTVYLSQGSSISGTYSAVIDGDAASSNFGSKVTIGDINADGINDLIVSSYLADLNSLTNSGAVYFFYGCTTGVCNGTGTATAKANLRITGHLANMNLGSSVAVRDFNNDGFNDLIITAEQSQATPSGPGQLYIFQNSGTGFSITSSSSANKNISGQTSADKFGFSAN